jgi:hypothetical protein
MSIKLFLAGDVMTGRGIDQILPHPCGPVLFEDYVSSARDYVALAERAHGGIDAPVPFDYIWGDALAELRDQAPDVRIANLETAVTLSGAAESKGINYRMSPANVGALCAASLDCCTLANNHVLDWGETAFRNAGITQGGGDSACRRRRDVNGGFTAGSHRSRPESPRGCSRHRLAMQRYSAPLGSWSEASRCSFAAKSVDPNGTSSR